MANRFVGYSTVDSFFGSQVLENRELAKRDLLNHFYTRKGERLGSPEFGSILPELIFEQLDEFTVEQVEEDVSAIVRLDPRWRLISLNTIIGEHSIECVIRLEYLPTTTVDELYLKFTTEEGI
jgi:phage baseplate assembly protein W